MNILNKINVLVTGSSGLVGTHLLMKLAKESNYNVIALYNKNYPRVVSDNITPLKVDLKNYDEVLDALKNIDIVYALAGIISRRPDNEIYLRDNVIITFNTLEAASKNKVRRLIWLSSATAYPPSNTPLSEDAMFSADPHDGYFSYAWTMRYLEKLCESFSKKLNSSLSVIILRPTAIYGENDDFNENRAHVLSSIVGRLSSGASNIEIWGDGKASRDFIYAGDVAQYCIEASQINENFNIFNIGMDKQTTVNEIIELVRKINNIKALKIIRKQGSIKKASRITLNCEKAKNAFGYTPEIDLKLGLEKTIRWFKINNLMST